MDYNDKAVERFIARAKHRQELSERREKRIAICGIIVIIGIVASLLSSAEFAKRDYTETTVIVSTGDTLWTIAKEYCPNDMDIRRYINHIQKDNDCTADIHNGDILTVRCYE